MYTYRWSFFIWIYLFCIVLYSCFKLELWPCSRLTYASCQIRFQNIISTYGHLNAIMRHSRSANIVGSLCDQNVASSVSDSQGSNFESCDWRAVSSHSSHHSQDVLLAQFSRSVHKGWLKPHSFQLISFVGLPSVNLYLCLASFQL